MKRLLVHCGCAVLAALLALSAAADEFVWQGNESNVLSLASPSSYLVDDAVATRLPGANDSITLDTGNYAEVDNSTIDFLNSVKYVWMKKDSKLVFNVTTNASVTVPISAYDTVKKTSSRVGTIEKNCASELSFTSVDQLFYGSNKYQYDYYCGLTKINAGALHIQETGDAANVSQIFVLGEMDVAQGATLFLPQPGYDYVWGLSGDGLITNDCAIADSVVIRIQGGPTTFGGVLAARSKLKSFQVVGRQAFTGRESPIDSNVLHLESVSGNSGYGYLGLASFGTEANPYGSIGNCSFQMRSAYTNHLEYLGSGGETVSKEIYLYGGLGYPQIIDAGANGGLTFTTKTWYGGTALASFGATDLVLTGSNTQECTLMQNLKDSVLTGTGSAGHQWEGQTRPLSLTKRGTGTWYAGDNNRTFSGIVAVEEGTLAFATIKDRGRTCSLGVATNCYESGNGREPFAKQDFAEGTPVGYAIRLGDPNDAGKTGTLEYRGAAALNCSTRPIVVAGSGRLLSTGAAFNFSGVSPYNAGENTLTLDGARDDSILGDVTNNVGSLSIVKKGAGTWKLIGEQTFGGDVTVEDGTLQIGDRYTWFTLNYRMNNTNATNWLNWKKHVRMSEFGLFDRDGVRCNANLEYTAKTSNLTTLTLEPGQTEYRQAPGAYHATGTYANCGPDKLFDGDAGTYHYAPNQSKDGMTDESASSLWIRVALRLPENSGEIVSFDLVPPSFSENSNVYAPISWSIEGSVDGITWDTLYETNGLTASDYTAGKWFCDGSDFSASNPHCGIPIKTATDGMTIAPTVRSVRVKPGATLNIEGGDVTVGRLVVDVAGMGTVKGLRLASTGTVDFAGDFEGDSFTVPADLSGLDGFDALSSGGWTFTHDGGSMGRYGARATAAGFAVAKKGFAFVVR